MLDCRRLLWGLLSAVVLFIPPARSQETLVVDLSENVVAITTGFVGSSLLLFGAAEGPGDIVVVVRGPLVDTVVRRKEKVAGVWVNSAEMVFEAAPEFYAVASNRAMDEFLSQDTRHAYQLGVDYLDLRPAKASKEVDEAAEFRAALVRNKQRQALYQTQPGNVQFIGSRRGGLLCSGRVWGHKYNQQEREHPSNLHELGSPRFHVVCPSADAPRLVALIRHSHGSTRFLFQTPACNPSSTSVSVVGGQ